LWYSILYIIISQCASNNKQIQISCKIDPSGLYVQAYCQWSLLCGLFKRRHLHALYRTTDPIDPSGQSHNFPLYSSKKKHCQEEAVQLAICHTRLCLYYYKFIYNMAFVNSERWLAKGLFKSPTGRAGPSSMANFQPYW
jgi:hypothetical protein